MDSVGVCIEYDTLRRRWLQKDMRDAVRRSLCFSLVLELLTLPCIHPALQRTSHNQVREVVPSHPRTCLAQTLNIARLTMVYHVKPSVYRSDIFFPQILPLLYHVAQERESVGRLG
jgi:hypothetical protein